MYLRDELHIHLYGCLDADDLHRLGAAVWTERSAQLQWYSDEYAKVTGLAPQPSRYWQSPGGADLLARDFLVTAPMTFDEFQVRFNLAIALFPIDPADMTIVRHVLAREAARGIRHGEYRTFIPARLSPEQGWAYLQNVTATLAETAGNGGFEAAVAFSLPRGPDVAARHYQLIKDFQRRYPDRGRLITAVDFCGQEEGAPPRLLAPLCQRIHEDNQRDPAMALAVLYHVGESFRTHTMASAVRWVAEAAAMGAHRLGHALAAGMDPANLISIKPEGLETETVREHQDHLRWLLRECDRLNTVGLDADPGRIRQQLTALQDLDPAAVLQWPIDDERLDDIRRLQRAVRALLRAENTVIECCPTSNFRLGEVSSPKHHPLPQFLADNLHLVVSTDDPGIFSISLASEEQLLRDTFGLQDADLEKLATNAGRFRSTIVSGRSDPESAHA